MDGQEATILGVAPMGFHGTNFALDLDGYIPLNMMKQEDAAKFWSDRSDRSLVVMGRLKPGVSLKQARPLASIGQFTHSALP